MEPADIVERFMDAINSGDADRLAACMTEDHVFVDAHGQKVEGRERMREGWRGYYAFCPDYRVAHETMIVEGNTVAVFGWAGGTVIAGGMLLEENRWRVPAAWRAVTEGDLVKEWRVYADNKIVFDILERIGAAPPQPKD